MNKRNKRRRLPHLNPDEELTRLTRDVLDNLTDIVSWNNLLKETNRRDIKIVISDKYTDYVVISVGISSTRHDKAAVIRLVGAAKDTWAGMDWKLEPDFEDRTRISAYYFLDFLPEYFVGTIKISLFHKK